MKNNQSTFLIAGKTGYIGSHTVLTRDRPGYDVVILDNSIYGHRYLVEEALKVPLIVGDIDISDRSLLKKNDRC